MHTDFGHVKPPSNAEIIDITRNNRFKDHLLKCITGPPSKSCGNRIEYLKKAVPKGFHKKLLLWNGKIAGQIEYSPAEVSYYPILGASVTVLNCIWVLRRARGHHYGQQLIQDMKQTEKGARGFATIALEDHWSPWFRKDQIEKLGFNSIDSVKVINKAKPRQAFTIHLMWMPNVKDAEPPTWDRPRLLDGITCCIAHPLYHPQTYREKRILQEQ